MNQNLFILNCNLLKCMEEIEIMNLKIVSATQLLRLLSEYVKIVTFSPSAQLFKRYHCFNL
jgi:hypothetical protein